jgi:hypothetical protein
LHLIAEFQAVKVVEFKEKSNTIARSNQRQGRLHCLSTTDATIGNCSCNYKSDIPLTIKQNCKLQNVHCFITGLNRDAVPDHLQLSV